VSEESTERQKHHLRVLVVRQKGTSTRHVANVWYEVADKSISMLTICLPRIQSFKFGLNFNSWSWMPKTPMVQRADSLWPAMDFYGIQWWI
jgi:hypothetical protein